MNRTLYKLIPITILPITILSIERYLPFQVGTTAIWWFIQAAILLIFWNSRKHFFENENKESIQVIQWFLIWNIICIVRGIFIAEIYWDWKFLIANAFGLLLPIVAYTASNIEISQSTLRFYLKYTLPVYIIFFFIVEIAVSGFYLVPISFLVLFLPVLAFRWRLIILSITLFVVFSDLNARSHVIKFGIPLLFSFIYYFRVLVSIKLLELIRKILFILPILFFLLAVTGIFNIFNIQDYIKRDVVQVKRDSNNEIIEEDLLSDTRTFLYVDVLQTAQKYNTWWIGRSPARGNETDWFSETDVTGRGERNANEVAILNIFTWTGIIGVVLYLIVFYKASHLAINHSRNIFSKILGLLIAFRWLYSWVEDVNDFSLTAFILWMMIGLCFSKSFREMTNEDVKYWIKNIVNNRKQKIPILIQKQF